jgi:8-oxo-dGTP pyrophosphatase MutT (NUDIX family)
MMTAPVQHNLFHVPSRLSFRDAAVAIIVLDDGRYLMQLRDDKPGIFYPDHWGLFGGAIDDGEDGEQALRRELREELDHDVKRITYFTRMDFDFESLGAKPSVRLFYVVEMKASQLDGLTLGEGRQMKALEAADILLERRVVPYDSFAIWMHCAWVRQNATETLEKIN